MTPLLAIITAPCILLTLSFAVAVFVGLKPLPMKTAPSVDKRSSVIIVPAHDEEAILLESLQQLKAAAEELAQVLLVADNCSDSTAQIGKRLGIEVIERFDEERRGKGFALDFGKHHLEVNPPQFVIVIDADCAMDAASLAALINSCAASGRPCQATYLQKPTVDASPAVQLSTFAFFIKNVIRQRALQRLAGRVHLLGTGMAFPWPIFAAAQLATNSIVEDLKLGQELAAAGHAPQLVEHASVWSNAETDRNTLSQRKRWEGGYLENALHAGPKALARSLGTADVRGISAAIDTMIPPFALLILLDVAVLAAGGTLTLLTTASYWPALLLAGALALSAVALACAWAAGGSRFVSLAGLSRAPFYLAWKLPMYLNLARLGAPKEWQRTGRE